MAHLLGAEALHHEFQHGVVFDSVTLGVNEGDRIGIVGRNGDGKSTLLSLLSGRLQPDSGRVTMRRGVTVGMLDQSDTLNPDQTVAHAVVGTTPEHVWAGDPRIRDVLDGLIENVPWDATVGDLSGGQRRRVALAAVLVGDHDVLFLDEPTNHLDIQGITWLAEHLRRRWPAGSGGFVVVTHDRWFLDAVCTTTWEVHDRVVEPFEGGYAAYILQRVERDRMAAVTEAKRQNLMKKELAWLRRGAPARTTKAKFRVDAANALIADEPPVRDKVELMRMATSRLGKEVVDLVDVSVSYGDKQVLREITWLIKPGERSGILGVNGAGKSTLLKLVTGAIKPTSGQVKRGKTIKVATLTQEPSDLDHMAGERVSDVIKSERNTYVAGGKEMTPAQLLERLGFKAAQLSNPVGKLSGGQKRRLQLLLILLNEPNVLVLDEPSNDLDTEMLAAMEDLLDSWPGTLLVVSHDRYLMERVTDQQYALLDGRLRHMPGGVDQYLELLRETSSRPAPVAKEQPRKLDAQAAREARKEIASIERKLAKLPAQIEEANKKIASHDQSDYLGLQEHVDALKVLQARQSDLETRWLELTEQLEAAS
ncbi:MAG TPA: ABC-F family ATP-binding cassette domain-containing protein [Actinomycetota bacterium]|nr:ABC-F family ATP-binding cassette domain-containing protein [Actinomycetota bacterium]